MMKVTNYTATLCDGVGSYRKDDRLDCQWSLVNLNTGREIVTVRTYWPGSTCYAVVWACGDRDGSVKGAACLGRSRGAGKAGGGGYCKRSAAVGAALASAGFQFSDQIAGRGEGAIEDALEAIAKCAGLNSRYVVIKANA